MTHNITVGLDLGQAADYSALVVVERLERMTGGVVDNLVTGERPDLEDVHHVRHIERFAIGTPYPAVVDRVGALLDVPTLREAGLVIDATGVGRPVVDLFRDAYRRGSCGNWWPVPITITAGTEASGDHVPKRLLISNLIALSQSGRLKFAADLPLANVLRHELLAFSIKVTAAGNDRYEALRERDHDDVVLALALACWHRHRHVTPRGIEVSGRIVDRDGATY